MIFTQTSLSWTRQHGWSIGYAAPTAIPTRRWISTGFVCRSMFSSRSQSLYIRHFRVSHHAISGHWLVWSTYQVDAHFALPVPTRRTFHTTVDRRWPGIQCCRSTSMEQPTGLCHLGRNSDSIPSQTKDISVPTVLFPAVVLAVAYHLGHFKNLSLIDWLRP